MSLPEPLRMGIFGFLFAIAIVAGVALFSSIFRGHDGDLVNHMLGFFMPHGLILVTVVTTISLLIGFIKAKKD